MIYLYVSMIHLYVSMIHLYVSKQEARGTSIVGFITLQTTNAPSQMMRLNVGTPTTRDVGDIALFTQRTCPGLYRILRGLRN